MQNSGAKTVCNQVALESKYLHLAAKRGENCFWKPLYPSPCAINRAQATKTNQCTTFNGIVNESSVYADSRQHAKISRENRPNTAQMTAIVPLVVMFDWFIISMIVRPCDSSMIIQDKRPDGCYRPLS